MLKNITVINNTGTVNVKLANVKAHNNTPTNTENGIKFSNNKAVVSTDVITFKNNAKIYIINNEMTFGTKLKGSGIFKIPVITFSPPGKVNYINLI